MHKLGHPSQDESGYSSSSAHTLSLNYHIESDEQRSMLNVATFRITLEKITLGQD
jgi:hypothetical protein